ncbi:MAG: 2-dehydropantoate 2-reductase [Chitinophagaceae bacterium]|nr:2-dehydropantoate 2-reductase [Chitinophagaceae bacterium]
MANDNSIRTNVLGTDNSKRFPAIYIIGAGAIGKALAVLLKRQNRKVILVRSSVSEELSYNEEIEVVQGDGTVIREEIKVRSLSLIDLYHGLIVLTNKSYGNERIAKILKERKTAAPIVILQNGLKVEEPFIVNNHLHIYRCVLFVTSQPNAKGQISFKPVTSCPIGIIRGDEETLDEIVSALSTTSFSFNAESDIQRIIWKKAIVNCVFNSICPLLDVDNGIFHRNKRTLDLATSIISECAAIATAAGVRLSIAEITESLLSISKASDGQFISTLQDIRNKRETEIGSLNLEMARIAASFNKQETIIKTTILGELTYLKSVISRQE